MRKREGAHQGQQRCPHHHCAAPPVAGCTPRAPAHHQVIVPLYCAAPPQSLTAPPPHGLRSPPLPLPNSHKRGDTSSTIMRVMTKRETKKVCAWEAGAKEDCGGHVCLAGRGHLGMHGECMANARHQLPPAAKPKLASPTSGPPGASPSASGSGASGVRSAARFM